MENVYVLKNIIVTKTWPVVWSSEKDVADMAPKKFKSFGLDPPYPRVLYYRRTLHQGPNNLRKGNNKE